LLKKVTHMKKLSLSLTVLLIALTALVVPIVSCGGTADDPNPGGGNGPGGVIHVTSVTLDQTTLSLTVGGIKTLTAKVMPDNAHDKEVTWMSSNPAVAMVSDGTVMAMASGIATIAAATRDGGHIATCAITVAVNVTSVALNKNVMMLPAGSAEPLTATVQPINATNKHLTWISSDKNIAEVSDGLVIAKAIGVAKITVITQDGARTAECALAVTLPNISVTGVKLNKVTTVIPTGHTETLVATVEPSNANNKAVTWDIYSKTPSNMTITVNENGLVTAGNISGNALVRVTTFDGLRTASCAVTVAPLPVEPTGVTLNKASTTIGVGGAERLIATIQPNNANQNTALTWETSNGEVAMVSNDGVVFVLPTTTPGSTATITVKVGDGAGPKSAICAVTVDGPIVPTGVVLNKPDMTLGIGGSEKLTATISPANATNKGITWFSYDKNIADVDTLGNVIGKGIGTTTITANTYNSLSAPCTVTVTMPIAVTGVTLDKDALIIGVGGIEKLTATIAPANATNKTVTWWTSDFTVATVSADGTVSAVDTGTATITAITLDGSHRADCAVTITNPIAVSGVLLNKNTASIPKGQTEKLTAAILPENATDKSLSWESENSTIVTVSDDGTVSAIAIGAAKITVKTIDGGFKAECLVTVTEPVPVEDVTLTPAELNIEVGESRPLLATVFPINASNKNVTYSIYGDAIARINDQGIVKGISSGRATATVTTEDGGMTADTTVNVGPSSNIETKGITITPNPASINTNGSSNLAAQITGPGGIPASEKELTWRVVSSTPATIMAECTLTGSIGLNPGSATALFTAGPTAGTVTIEAESIDYPGVVSSPVVLSITAPSGKPVTDVSIDKTTLQPLYKLGALPTFTATVLPVDAANPTLNWTSSEPKVTATGGVLAFTGTAADIATAGGTLTAIITAAATDGSGKEDFVTVNITYADVTSVLLNGVASQTTSRVHGTSGDFSSYAVTFAPVGLCNPATTLSWTSSKSSVVDVDNDGNYTITAGSAPDTAIITVSATSGTPATITVNVVASSVDATGIIISTKPPTIKLDNATGIQLAAAVQPPGATNPDYLWSIVNDGSNTGAGLDISSVGLLTLNAGAKVGDKATITATSDDTANGGPHTDSFIVTVAYADVTDVLLDGLASQTISLTEGTNGTFSYIVTIEPSGLYDPATVLTWTSNGTAIDVSANDGSYIIAAASASATPETITIEASTGNAATIAVTIQASGTPDATGITITSPAGGTSNLALGSSGITMTAQVAPSGANQGCSWLLVNDAGNSGTGLSISSTGALTLNAGAQVGDEATITVTADDTTLGTWTDTHTVTVIYNTGVTDVELSPTTTNSVMTSVGTTLTIESAVMVGLVAGIADPAVTFTIPPPTVVLFTQTGNDCTAVAVSSGTASVTATSSVGGVTSAPFTVTVDITPTDIEFDGNPSSSLPSSILLSISDNGGFGNLEALIVAAVGGPISIVPAVAHQTYKILNSSDSDITLLDDDGNYEIIGTPTVGTTFTVDITTYAGSVAGGNAITRTVTFEFEA
jgi:uncharacterized protein YjdB